MRQLLISITIILGFNMTAFASSDIGTVSSSKPLDLGHTAIKDSSLTEQLKNLPVGESRSVGVPAGDGCNTCSRECTRISENKVQCSMIDRCTLVSCGPFYDTIVVPYDKGEKEN